ncbi:hypothetical protein GGF37_002010 [Kickxella alabastrina]|nr:hypothetical protein GGF37_002010 [Kickxella alabastrina]
MNSGGDNNDEKERNRQICLDTESSICLAFDKTLYPSQMLGSMADIKSLDLSIGQDIMMIPAEVASSDTHFIPRIHEVNGSSDSQQQFTHLLGVGKKPTAAGSSSLGQSSRHCSVATTDMAYAGDTEDYFQGVSDADTEMDRELQAAIDTVLEGRMPTINGVPSKQNSQHAVYNRNGILGSARKLTGKLFRANDSAFVPVDLGQQPQPQQQQSAMVLPPLSEALEPADVQPQRRTLGKLFSDRFSRRREETPSLSDGQMSMSSMEKESTERKIDSVIPDDQKSIVRAACCLPEPVTGPPRRGNKFLRPITEFVQKRPLASLGIALAGLVVFLVIIIILLICAVFPFLMRSTLQDVSLVVTSVHALPPAEVSRALSIARADRVDPRDGFGRNARLGLEPVGIQAVHNAPKALWVRDIQKSVAPVQHQQSQHQSHRHHLAVSSAVHNGGSALTALRNEPMTVRVSAHSSRDTRSLEIQVSASSATTTTSLHASPQGFKRVVEDEVVTLTSISISTVHIQMQRSNMLPTHTATSTSLTRATSVAEVHNAPESNMAGSITATSYMLRVGGNLTSGGPIGVNIEFTEPLRMIWRDIEVGVIERPESIHIPGKGTAQWTWPDFEVLIPNLSGDKSAVVQRHMQDGSAVLGRASTDNTRADIDQAGSAHEGLTNWFGAISAHRSFTMLWKSRVRVSAIGLHTDNITFEKLVNVVCGESGSCTIDGTSFVS